MTDMPAWFNQLEWSPVFPIDSFITGKVSRKVISAYPGVYVFSPTEQSLRTGNALYVGKADGLQQSLRRRISIYLRRFGRIAGPASRHAGCELLFERYYKPRKVVIYLRWAGCTAP